MTGGTSDNFRLRKSTLTELNDTLYKKSSLGRRTRVGGTGSLDQGRR